jgi:hypothetical protein
MAASQCLKCGNAHFEAVDIEPDNVSVDLLAIQCAACGAVVGIVENEVVSDTIGTMLGNHEGEIGKKFDDLKTRLSGIGRQLGNVLETLQALKK